MYSITNIHSSWNQMEGSTITIARSSTSPKMRASSRNRDSTRSEAASARRNLIATSFANPCGPTSHARYTTPKTPSPRREMMRYRRCSDSSARESKPPRCTIPSWPLANTLSLEAPWCCPPERWSVVRPAPNSCCPVAACRESTQRCFGKVLVGAPETWRVAAELGSMRRD